MSAPRKYPEELRERAVRLVLDVAREAGSVSRACRRIGEQLGINADTLRGWVKRAQIDAGARPGVSTAEAARVRQLEKENAELRRANAILRTASAFFAAELCATRRRDNRGGVKDLSRRAVAAA
jgi:transposase